MRQSNCGAAFWRALLTNLMVPMQQQAQGGGPSVLYIAATESTIQFGPLPGPSRSRQEGPFHREEVDLMTLDEDQIEALADQFANAGL